MKLPVYIRWFLYVLLGLAGLVSLVACVIMLHMRRHPDIPPPDVSDLIPERREVPDEQNAYLSWVAAAKLYVEDPDVSLHDELNEDGTLRKDILQLLEKNQPAFEMLKSGLKRPDYYHDVEYTIDYLIPEISKGLELSKLLRFHIQELRRKGELDAAIEIAGVLTAYGTRMSHDGSVLIQYLVGLAIFSMGSDQTQAILHEQGLTRQQLEAIWAGLPDSSVFQVGAKRAFQSEFMIFKSMIDSLATGEETVGDLIGMPGKKKSWWVDIIFKMDYMFQPNRTTALLAQEIRTSIENSDKPIYHEVAGRDFLSYWHRLDRFQRLKKPNSFGMLLLAVVMPSLKGAERKSRETMATNEALKVSVALRLYELDHGFLPETLAELVPEYLDAVPLDPFDGEPLRYNRDRTVVYSVGEDTVDNGGSSEDEDLIFPLRKPEPVEPDASWE